MLTRSVLALVLLAHLSVSVLGAMPMLPQVGRAHISGGGHRLAEVGVRHHSGLNGHAKYTMPESMAYPNSFQEDYTNEEGVQPMFSKPHIREVQGPGKPFFATSELHMPSILGSCFAARSQ